MAQHDYVIDNQAFPATRADINSVLQAIVSNNSGSSAPSTTFANQIWYDSSANILYMRNEDNDANIPLLQLDQSADVAATLATLIDVLDASGTNQAGTTLTIQGGASTGSGAAGKILMKTTPAGSSGSSVNSHATMLAVGGSGVGIGHDTPTAELHIKGDTTDDQVIIENTNSGAANAPDLTLFRNSSSPADNDVLGILRFDGKNDAAETIEYAVIQAKADDVSDGTEDGLLIFKNMIAGTLTETMRLDSGNLLIGTTGLPSSTNKGTAFIPASLDRTKLSMSSASTSSGVELVAFRNPNGEVGTIATSSSSTSYNTSSDYRLKENVTNITDGIERVKKLNPSRFNFIADADTTVDGFLAHEVSDIVPEAITGEKDAMMDEEYVAKPEVLDDDGNVVTKAVMATRNVPSYQGIDQSKLVPLLTAALQEAVAKIEALETRVTALEG